MYEVKLVNQEEGGGYFWY